MIVHKPFECLQTILQHVDAATSAQRLGVVGGQLLVVRFGLQRVNALGNGEPLMFRATVAAQCVDALESAIKVRR